MDLKLADVAEFLNVSEVTVERWVESGSIPSYQWNGEIRFNRLEVENWVMSASQEGYRFFEVDSWNQFGLYRALHKGGVLHTDEDQGKESLIRDVMSQIAEPLSLDTDLVSELFIDREKLMSTSLGHGIAVPHARDFLLTGLFDAITVVFPKNPIDWGSLDGQPVHTLFFLFSCDDRRHLNLLAKIAHIASNPEILAFLQKKPSRAELMTYIKSWESSVRTAVTAIA